MAVDLTPVMCGTFANVEGYDGVFTAGSIAYEAYSDCAGRNVVMMDMALYRAIQAELQAPTNDSFYTDSSVLWGLGLVAVVTVFAFKAILLRLFHFS